MYTKIIIGKRNYRIDWVSKIENRRPSASMKKGLPKICPTENRL